MAFKAPSINLKSLKSGGGLSGDGADSPKKPTLSKPIKRSKSSLSRKSQFILFVGDEGGILVLMQQGKVTKRLYAPSPEEQHIKTFVELIQEHSKTPISILVDMIDQSYVRHTIPPVSALSVNKIVQRRLERDFVPEDLTGALPLGREKTGRKEWNFLLIALANSALLQQWTDMVLEQPNHFKGIYLAPVEAQEYINKLSITLLADREEDSSWKILVSHNKVGGFRQVVMKDGKLIFTRLTQAVSENSAEVIAGSIEQEVLNTIEYLKRLSFNDRDGLDIFIVTAQEIKDAVDASKFNATFVGLLTPYDVSEALGLEQAALSADRFGDVVMATVFAGLSKAKLKMHTAYSKQLDSLHKMEVGIKSIAAVLLVGMIYLSLASFWGMFSANSNMSVKEREKQAAMQDMAEIQRDLTALGDDVNQLMNVTALYEEVQPHALDPLNFIQEYVKLMDAQALVKQFNWERVQTQAASNRRGATAQDASSETIKTEIEMEFTGHGGSRVKLVNDATAFMEKLETAFSDYDVKNEKLPGTVSQDENLQLNFDDPSSSSESLVLGEELVKLTIEGPKNKQAN